MLKIPYKSVYGYKVKHSLKLRIITYKVKQKLERISNQRVYFEVSRSANELDWNTIRTACPNHFIPIPINSNL